MSSVIDELAGDGVVLDRVYVDRRVRDWAKRVTDLYKDIEPWVHDFAVDQVDSIEMDEPMMHAHGVSPVRLPILRITDADGEVAKLMPRGLWVIGTNGRLTMFSRRGQFVLVDRADVFESPRWEMSPALHRSDRHWLSRETFRQAIE